MLIKLSLQHHTIKNSTQNSPVTSLIFINQAFILCFYLPFFNFYFRQERQIGFLKDRITHLRQWFYFIPRMVGILVCPLGVMGRSVCLDRRFTNPYRLTHITHTHTSSLTLTDIYTSKFRNIHQACRGLKCRLFVTVFSCWCNLYINMYCVFFFFAFLISTYVYFTLLLSFLKCFCHQLFFMFLLLMSLFFQCIYNN